MRATRDKSGTWLWISARETWDWAHKPRGLWPYSEIAGHRLFVAFTSKGDLVDVAIDGSNADVSVFELNAITSDFLRARFGADHPAIRSEDSGWPRISLRIVSGSPLARRGRSADAEDWGEVEEEVEEDI